MNFGLDERGRVATIDAPYEWSEGHVRAQRTKYGHYDNGWVRSVSDERIVNPADNQNDPAFVPDHQHDYIYDRRGLQTDWIADKNVTGTVAAKGRRIHREFFDNGLLKSRSARASQDDTTPRIYSYEYDANGSLTKLLDTDLGRTTSVSYDSADRALRFNETWGGGRDTVYAYDADSNVTSRKVDGTLNGTAYTGGRETTFEFDAVGRETTMRVKVPGAQTDRVTTTSYWPSDQVRTHDESGAGGATEKTFFNDDGRLARMTRDTATTSGGTLKNQAYTYDENGNRTRDERGAHLFNARDQLVTWTRATGTPDAGSTVDYELNAAGAVLKKTDSAASTPVTTYEYSEDPAPGTRYVGDRLIKTVQGARTTTYEYNPLGDITKIHPSTGTDTTYAYDDFERRRTTTSGATTETYSYDALDRRDTTTRGANTFDNAYIGLTEQLSREQQTTGGTQTSTYDYNSGLQRQGQSTQTTSGAAATYRSYAVDANGSVEGLQDATGTLAANDTYTYDPYGELEGAAPTGSAASAPFRFQGFYSDSAVKTYDMQARSYRPDIGRFLSQDRFESASADVALQSDPLTQNRYAFAGGNPVNNVEFDGHAPCKYVLTKGSGKCPSAKTQKAAAAANASGHTSGADHQLFVDYYVKYPEDTGHVITAGNKADQSVRDVDTITQKSKQKFAAIKARKAKEAAEGDSWHSFYGGFCALTLSLIGCDEDNENFNQSKTWTNRALLVTGVASATKTVLTKGGGAMVGVLRGAFKHEADDVATKAADHAIPIGPGPQNAWKVLDRVTSKGAPLPGYKGGKAFENNGKGMVLPRSNADGAIKYREWDVNPYVKGQNRGSERLVTGSDGSAYSTRDHYDTFVRIR